MAFPDSVIQQAQARSGGRCECKRTAHGHYGRCNNWLCAGSRGWETIDGWKAHHISAGGLDTLSNCEILCEECQKQTTTYGG